jgi:hypothetical protein
MVVAREETFNRAIDAVLGVVAAALIAVVAYLFTRVLGGGLFANLIITLVVASVVLVGLVVVLRLLHRTRPDSEVPDTVTLDLADPRRVQAVLDYIQTLNGNKEKLSAYVGVGEQLLKSIESQEPLPSDDPRVNVTAANPHPRSWTITTAVNGWMSAVTMMLERDMSEYQFKGTDSPEVPESVSPDFRYAWSNATRMLTWLRSTIAGMP